MLQGKLVKTASCNLLGNKATAHKQKTIKYPRSIKYLSVINIT